MASFRKLVINCLVVGVSFALALGITEAAIRVMGLWYIPPAQPDWYKPSAIAGVPYVLKPNLDVDWGLGRIKSNSIGLRDAREPGAAKQGPRILAIGDSLTFSFGVDQNDTYPRWMERLYADAAIRGAAPTAPLEVINAGMNGYNLADAASLLPGLLDQYRPDLVIWFTITNDYDGSLHAEPSGELSSITQTLSATTLARWGYRWDGQVDSDDFRNSMTPEARATLDPTRPAPQKNSARIWLARHSALAAMIEHVIAQPGGADMTNTVPNKLLAYTEIHQSTKGPIPFPEHHAIFYLPSHADKSAAAIRSAQAAARARNVPLMLVNAALPVDAGIRTAAPGYRYYDLTTLLRQPFNAAQRANNLGWDPHLNPRGNRLLATAMLDGVTCAKLLSGNAWQADCAAVGEWDALGAGYWSDYAQRHSRWQAGLAPSIDFVKPSGVHQIAGGVGMDRQFPLPPPYVPSATFVLNGAGASRPSTPSPTHLAIEAESAEPSRFEVEARSGSKSVRAMVAFDSKQRTQIVDLASLAQPDASNVLEVEFRCIDAAACRPVRLVRLGMNAAPAQ